MKWGKAGEPESIRSRSVSRKRREGKTYHIAEIRFPRAGKVWSEPWKTDRGHRLWREWDGETRSGEKRRKVCQSRSQSAESGVCVGHHRPTLAGRREGWWKRGDGLVESEFNLKPRRQPLEDYAGKQHYLTWILARPSGIQYVGWSGKKKNCQ